MRRAGRPGLVGTMARTAIISGTATAVSGRVARRQSSNAAQKAQAEAYEEAQRQAALQAQMQAAQQAAAPPPAPAPAEADDPVAKLKELAELKAAGVLTDEEFAAMKAKILAS
jgi:hypothetical protein